MLQLIKSAFFKNRFEVPKPFKFKISTFWSSEVNDSILEQRKLAE